MSKLVRIFFLHLLSLILLFAVVVVVVVVTIAVVAELLLISVHLDLAMLNKKGKARKTNDIINNKRKIDIKYLFIIQIYDCSSISFIASISFSSMIAIHTNTLTI